MEIWANIKEFPEYYISNLGRVKTLNYNHTGKTELLNCFKNISGYKAVNLMMGGIRKRKLIHQLVAVHFIENKQNLKSINHKDGDKANNWADNLEWCTAKHNSLHAIKYQLGKDNRRAKDLIRSELRAIHILLHKEVNMKYISEAFQISYSCLKQIKNELSRSSE